jgi:hypothetical protein
MSPAPCPWLEDGSTPCGRFRNPEPIDATVAERGCDISVAARVVGMVSPQRAELSRIRSGLLGSEGVSVVRFVADCGPMQVIRLPSPSHEPSLMAGFST